MRMSKQYDYIWDIENERLVNMQENFAFKTLKVTLNVKTNHFEIIFLLET